jgi:hypothetical protein
MAEQMQYEFEVLRGHHALGKDSKTDRQIIYKPGDTIKTTVDLNKYNKPGSIQFQMMNETVVKPVKSGKA